MGTVRQAIEDMGLRSPGDAEIILATHVAGSEVPPRLYRLDNIADRDVSEFDNLFISSGFFRKGTVGTKYGRESANVESVWCLTFDCDLSGFLSIGNDQGGKHLVQSMTSAEIMPFVAEQRAEVEAVFASLHLPIHRLIYTGHGLMATMYLESHTIEQPGDLERIRRGHDALLELINETAHYDLVDRAGKDSGVRMVRVPGSTNTKGAEPRIVSVLSEAWRYLPHVTLDQLDRVADGANRTPVSRPAAIRTGPALDSGVVSEIESAIAPHLTEGKRHVVSLGLAGMLAKAGVPEDQAHEIFEHLSFQDREWKDRLRCVKTTYKRAANRQSTAGYRGLEGWIPQSALDFIGGKLKAYQDAITPAVPRLIIGGKPAGPQAHSESEPKKATIYPQIPESAFYGWYGKYRDLMAPTTEAPDAFHLGAILTITGALVGRTIWTKYASEQLYPNFYTVLVGASGSSRKDTAIKRAVRLPQYNTRGSQSLRVENQFVVRRDISSGEGLVTVLKEESNLLLYISELTTMLRNIKRESTKSLGDKLIEAWDTPDSMQNLNKQSPVYASNPYLSIISGTQPGRLEEEMTDTEINSGFGNRWMFFAGVGKPKVANPPDVDEIAAAKLYKDFVLAIRPYGSDTFLRLSLEAQDRWDAWYLDDVVDDADEDKQSMRIRHSSLVQKVALLYAISDSEPEICDRHLSAAISLIDWMWLVVQQLMPTWGSTTDRKIEERIISALRRYGPLPRRRIQQLTSGRRWSAKDFASVFRSMVENGTINSDQDGLTSLPDDRRLRGAG